MKDLWLILANIALPMAAGIAFFALARYSSHIAPMRTLVTGDTTYKGASWGFAFFGAYLMTRPLQILLGPGPMPLVINSVREFCMMGLFAPAVFIAMMSLCFGADRIPRKFIVGTFSLGILMGLTFLAINAKAMGPAAEIFRIGNYAAYDGQWFTNPDPDAQRLMPIMFLLRFLNPLSLLLLSGVVVFRAARHYAPHKKAVYDNMPKKLYLLSAAVFAFPFSMLVTGALVLFGIPNQWWIYYLGALISAFIEAVSLALPLRKDVQVSEHAQ